MSTACVSTKRASARLRENPAQRYASNYFFVFNGYLAPGEQPVDESTTRGAKSTIIKTPTLVIWG